MIESKDISVVIQGPVQKETIILIKSIRHYLPDAEIVLSTWKGSKTTGIKVDKLILNEDPGAVSCVIDKKRVANYNRQIISSANGIAASTRAYVLKCRSDMDLLGTGFLNYWDMYPQRDSCYTLAKHKILISSLYTIKGEFFGDKFHPTPFHISDWYAFGTRADLTMLFDQRLVKADEFTRYFVRNPRPVEYNIPLVDERYWRFSPEQYLGLCYAKKWKSDIDFPNCLAYENVDFEMAERFVVNNFIIIEPQESQIVLNKRTYYNMCRNPIFYEDHVRSTAYRRYLYESDYQKYCDPRFIPQKDNLSTLVEKKFICNIQEEYQRSKRGKPDEYDFAVITPTYRGHFQFIPAYLESFRKYVTDKERVPIYFTVGGDEYFEFCNLISPYTNDLCIHVLPFEIILEYFGIKVTPDELLSKYWRYSFQTLKKFYTMLYIKKSRYLVLDSESVWIAPVSMKKEFDAYFAAPFVPCSPLALRGDGKTAKIVIENVENILGFPTNRWYIESFSWFYERRILEEMFDELGGPLEAVKQVYRYENQQHRSLNLGLMEIILYTVYLEKKHQNQYTFIDVYDNFQEVLSTNQFYRYMREVDAVYQGESGIAEHVTQFLTEENWKPLAEFYKKNHFDIIRCETGSDENYALQKKFLAAADVKILAASQDHRFLPSMTGTIVQPAGRRKRERWTLSGFLLRLRTKIKRLMMNIFPAYRVATDTRFKLESFIGETNSHFAQTTWALEDIRRQTEGKYRDPGRGEARPTVRRSPRKAARPKKRETEEENKA